MAGERAEVRSSELDIGLSSSDNQVWRWTRRCLSLIRLLYQSLFRLWLRSALWRKNIYGVLGSIFSSLVRRRYVFLVVTRRLVLLPMVMYVFMRLISSMAFIFPFILLFTSC